MGNLAEPGLILTPPAQASAADGTPGGEGLSGLARAFLFAGSRALLVSHWPVASEPTRDLMISTMRAYQAAPTRGKATALRGAILAMIDQPATAPPFYWAPFVVVGD